MPVGPEWAAVQPRDRRHRRSGYHAVPRVTFTDPEVGAVGLTERQARAAGRPVRVATTSLPSSARGWIHKAGNDGFIKVVEHETLIGATAAGPSRRRSALSARPRRPRSAGTLQQVIEVPVAQVTAVTFAGNSLTELIITTSSYGLGGNAEAAAGALFHADPGVGGQSVRAFSSGKDRSADPGHLCDIERESAPLLAVGRGQNFPTLR